jgi:ferredoxin
MRVIADPGRCAGAGQRVLTDPALFDQSEAGGTVIGAAGPAGHRRADQVLPPLAGH